MAQGLSEDRLLAVIDRLFARGKLPLGRGDDCAVLDSFPLAISSDLFLEDIHFRLGYFTPGEIGHKALAVNLSDLAAMGAAPLGFSLCLGIPHGLSLPWLEEMLAGMAQLAKAHNLILIGGDLSAADKLHLSITIYGTGNFLTRHAAKPGDILFVAGQLGLARAGLRQLEESGRNAIAAWPNACAAHLLPDPLIHTGLALAELHPAGAVALMDVSDGVARDLARMLAASSLKRGVSLGADLHLRESQLHPEVVACARMTGDEPVDFALAGGEDYALLGACPERLWPLLAERRPEVWQLGQITSEPGIRVNRIPLTPVKGFDHFS